MMPSRRTFLCGIAATAVAETAVSSPFVLSGHRRRVSQNELDAAIEKHAHWLDNPSGGERATFANCDLNGLTFKKPRYELVNLRGSDFTQTDLTGVTGNLVSFNHASLHGALLSWSRLSEPGLICASLRSAQCDNAIWGWRIDGNDDANDMRAVFHHTDASRTDFTNAKVRGQFVGATLTMAQLININFQGSEFIGDDWLETSFSRSDLTGAIFNDAKLQSVRFQHAKMSDINWEGSELHPRLRHKMKLAGQLPPDNNEDMA